MEGAMKILHCYADDGVESEVLSAYGEVIRVGLNPKDTNQSEPIKADAKELPFREDTFDLGLFHPPCGYVSPLSDTKGGSRDDWPNLIPVAREQAQRVCEHYVIENKKQATKDMVDPVVLDGGMFGLPMDYARAFETSFPVDQPPRNRTFGDAEYQPFFSSEHSKEAWAAAKGYPPNYQKGHLAKNCVPRSYLQYLMRHYFEAVDNDVRPDYSDYDTEMDAKRSKEANAELEEWL